MATSTTVKAKAVVDNLVTYAGTLSTLLGVTANQTKIDQYSATGLYNVNDAIIQDINQAYDIITLAIGKANTVINNLPSNA